MGKSASGPPDHARRHYGSPGRFVGRIWRPSTVSVQHCCWAQRFSWTLQIKLNIIRSTCYRLRVRSHLLLSGIQIACVLHLSLVKFQQEWSQDVANPEKNASHLVSKTATAATASKTWFAKLPSGVSLLYPKQCIAMETVPCDHLVIFHEFCLCAAVGMPSEAFLYQTFLYW